MAELVLVRVPPILAVPSLVLRSARSAVAPQRAVLASPCVGVVLRVFMAARAVRDGWFDRLHLHLPDTSARQAHTPPVLVQHRVPGVVLMTLRAVRSLTLLILARARPTAPALVLSNKVRIIQSQSVTVRAVQPSDTTVTAEIVYPKRHPITVYGVHTRLNPTQVVIRNLSILKAYVIRQRAVCEQPRYVMGLHCFTTHRNLSVPCIGTGGPEVARTEVRPVVRDRAVEVDLGPESLRKSCHIHSVPVGSPNRQLGGHVRSC